MCAQSVQTPDKVCIAHGILFPLFFGHGNPTHSSAIVPPKPPGRARYAHLDRPERATNKTSFIRVRKAGVLSASNSLTLSWLCAYGSFLRKESVATVTTRSITADCTDVSQSRQTPGSRLGIRATQDSKIHPRAAQTACRGTIRSEHVQENAQKTVFERVHQSRNFPRKERIAKSLH